MITASSLFKVMLTGKRVSFAVTVINASEQLTVTSFKKITFGFSCFGWRWFCSITFGKEYRDEEDKNRKDFNRFHRDSLSFHLTPVSDLEGFPFTRTLSKDSQ